MANRYIYEIPNTDPFGWRNIRLKRIDDSKIGIYNDLNALMHIRANISEALTLKLYDSSFGDYRSLTVNSGGLYLDGTLVGTNPAGSGTELQYKSGSTFGALTGSSVSGSDLTLGGNLLVNGAIQLGSASTGLFDLMGTLVALASNGMVVLDGSYAPKPVSASQFSTNNTPTSNAPAVYANQTWNNVAVPFTLMYGNVTDSASASTSNLIDLQVGATSRFKVDKSATISAGSTTVAGSLSFPGSAYTPTISRSSNGDALTISRPLVVSGGDSSIFGGIYMRTDGRPLQFSSGCALEWSNSTDAPLGTVDAKILRNTTGQLDVRADSGLRIRNLANGAYASLSSYDLTTIGGKIRIMDSNGTYGPKLKYGGQQTISVEISDGSAFGNIGSGWGGDYGALVGTWSSGGTGTFTGMWTSPTGKFRIASLPGQGTTYVEFGRDATTGAGTVASDTGLKVTNLAGSAFTGVQAGKLQATSDGIYGLTVKPIAAGANGVYFTNLNENTYLATLDGSGNFSTHAGTTIAIAGSVNTVRLNATSNVWLGTYSDYNGLGAMYGTMPQHGFVGAWLFSETKGFGNRRSAVHLYGFTTWDQGEFSFATGGVTGVLAGKFKLSSTTLQSLSNGGLAVKNLAGSADGPLTASTGTFSTGATILNSGSLTMSSGASNTYIQQSGVTLYVSNYGGAGSVTRLLNNGVEGLRISESAITGYLNFTVSKSDTTWADANIPTVMVENTATSGSRTATIKSRVSGGYTLAQPEIWIGSENAVSGITGTFVRTVSNHPMIFYTNDVKRFELTAAGHIVPSTHNVTDLGLTGTRFKDAYLQGTLYTNTGLSITGELRTAVVTVVDRQGSPVLRANSDVNANMLVASYNSTNGTKGFLGGIGGWANMLGLASDMAVGFSSLANDTPNNLSNAVDSKIVRSSAGVLAVRNASNLSSTLEVRTIRTTSADHAASQGAIVLDAFSGIITQGNAAVAFGSGVGGFIADNARGFLFAGYANNVTNGWDAGILRNATGPAVQVQAAGGLNVTNLAGSAGAQVTASTINLSSTSTGITFTGINSARFDTPGSNIIRLFNASGGVQISCNAAPVELTSAGSTGLKVLHTGGATIENPVSPDTTPTLKLIWRGTQTAALLDAYVSSNTTGNAITVSTDSTTPFAVSKLGAVTLTGASTTTSNPMLNVSQTWNNAAVAFTLASFNATATAAANGSKLLQIGTAGDIAEIAVQKVASAGNHTAAYMLMFGGAYSISYSPEHGKLAIRNAANTGDGSLRVGGLQSTNYVSSEGYIQAGSHAEIGAASWRGSTRAFTCANTAGYHWSSTSNVGGSVIVGFNQVSGVVEVNSGTTGDYRDLKARTYFGVGGTVTASTPVLDVSQIWNNAGVNFTGIKGNFTATAHAGNSLLMDLQLAGVSKFSVAYDGAITTPVDKQFGTSEGQQRLYFANNSHTYYGAGASSNHIFRRNNGAEYAPIVAHILSLQMNASYTGNGIDLKNNGGTSVFYVDYQGNMVLTGYSGIIVSNAHVTIHQDGGFIIGTRAAWFSSASGTISARNNSNSSFINVKASQYVMTQSTAPTVASGEAVTWIASGSGTKDGVAYDQGDYLITINVGGVSKTKLLTDYSTL